MTTSPGKPSAKTKKAAQQIRSFALSFPETREDHPWGHAAFKVNGKVFVFMGEDDSGLGLSCKLKLSQLAALELPFASPTHYGMGKHGWVSASFGPEADVPLPLLESWITESYGLIAPKRVLKALASGARPTTVTPAKAPARRPKAAPGKPGTGKAKAGKTPVGKTKAGKTPVGKTKAGTTKVGKAKTRKT